MNTSHQRWLLEQLPQWERDGLLTADAARTLRERHAIDASQPGLAQIVMGSLGALLIGTGLIAVIGYNWDDFSRPVRLLFAFLPLLTTQIISFRVLQRGDAAAAWVRETAALLQALATGACIALVSQIYNLGGHLGPPQLYRSSCHAPSFTTAHHIMRRLFGQFGIRGKTIGGIP